MLAKAAAWAIGRDRTVARLIRRCSRRTVGLLGPAPRRMAQQVHADRPGEGGARRPQLGADGLADALLQGHHRHQPVGLGPGAGALHHSVGGFVEDGHGPNAKPRSLWEPAASCSFVDESLNGAGDRRLDRPEEVRDRVSDSREASRHGSPGVRWEPRVGWERSGRAV